MKLLPVDAKLLLMHRLQVLAQMQEKSDPTRGGCPRSRTTRARNKRFPGPVVIHSDDVTEVRSADPVLTVFRFWRRERS